MLTARSMRGGVVFCVLDAGCQRLQGGVHVRPSDRRCSAIGNFRWRVRPVTSGWSTAQQAGRSMPRPRPISGRSKGWIEASSASAAGTSWCDRPARIGSSSLATGRTRLRHSAAGTSSTPAAGRTSFWGRLAPKRSMWTAEPRSTRAGAPSPASVLATQSHYGASPPWTAPLPGTTRSGPPAMPAWPFKRHPPGQPAAPVTLAGHGMADIASGRLGISIGPVDQDGSWVRISHAT